MVYLAIIALLGGIACGMTGLDENVIVSWITSNKDMILYLLMFLVGISIGFNRGIVSKIKEYHIKIFCDSPGNRSWLYFRRNRGRTSDRDAAW